MLAIVGRSILKCEASPINLSILFSSDFGWNQFRTSMMRGRIKVATVVDENSSSGSERSTRRVVVKRTLSAIRSSGRSLICRVDREIVRRKLRIRSRGKGKRLYADRVTCGVTRSRRDSLDSSLVRDIKNRVRESLSRNTMGKVRSCESFRCAPELTWSITTCVGNNFQEKRRHVTRNVCRTRFYSVLLRKIKIFLSILDCFCRWNT